jgi:hypothetical protein
MLNFPLATLIGFIGAGLAYGYKQMRQNPDIKLSNCFFEHAAAPLYTLLNTYYSNSGLIVDSVKENSIICNTSFKELFGIKLEGGDNTINYLNNMTIDNVYREFRRADDGYLYYVILKRGQYQKQYIFTHNKNLASMIGSYYDCKLMSGNELGNAILDLYLQNNYLIQNKKIEPVIKVDFNKINPQEPDYMTFKKTARSLVYKALNELKVYQSYKFIDGIKKADIQRLLREDFEGAIWTYFDFSRVRIENQLTKLITAAKWASSEQQKYFNKLKEYYSGGETLVLTQNIAFFKNIKQEAVGAIGNNLKVAFLPQDLFRRKSIQKTPLKYRNGEFDFLVDGNFMKNYITPLHVVDCKKPDIYGIDKNKAFVNYSFSERNNNPFMAIIAKAGSGKSLSKQKMISQMIDLDFATAEAKNLGNHGVKVRSYDVGFSDEKLINFVKSNKKNSIAHIESDIANFAYNLVNINMKAGREEIEADKQFAAEMLALIIESQNRDSKSVLTGGQIGMFKDAIQEVYNRREWQDYRIRNLKDSNPKLANKLCDILGYKENDYIKDIKESEFEFLNRPLLQDVADLIKIKSADKQISEDDRELYSGLYRVCNDVIKLGIFNKFDNVQISDANFISMDLNNFKDNSLFVPIFLSIFQKTYLKDREYALECRRKNIQAPKLFYAFEEVRNFFIVDRFKEILKKVVFEGRKYNLHLCFIGQNVDHIPPDILMNIDTKIFLLVPDKKEEVIAEVKRDLEPSDKVIEALRGTEQYELCIWYSKGVFNLKFMLSEKELALFNTNPNLNSELDKK